MADQTISLHDFAATMRLAECRVLCRSAAELARSSALPRKIRGALGHALAEFASREAIAGASCPFDPPSAFDLFHNDQMDVDKGMRLTKPFVIAADAAGDDLVITLRLFGGACDWAGEFRAGLVAGARRGIAFGDRRVALDVVGATRGPVDPPLIPEPGQELRLRTITDILFRPQPHSKDAGVRPLARLTGLKSRLEGLALWQGEVMIIDEAALSAEIEAAAPLVGSTGTLRGPRNIKGRSSFRGELVFPRAGPILTTFAALAPILHLGADTSSGAGRVEFLVAPGAR